jgi:hypothetical protein
VTRRPARLAHPRKAVTEIIRFSRFVLRGAVRASRCKSGLRDLRIKKPISGLPEIDAQFNASHFAK